MWFWISFTLLGLLIYLPIGVLIYCFCILPITMLIDDKHSDIAYHLNVLGVIILTILAILFHGGLFGWYKSAPNEIVINPSREVTSDSFYKSEEKDGITYLTFSDDADGTIEFEAKNIDSSDQKNLDWKVKITPEDGHVIERDYASIRTDSYYALFEGNKQDIYNGTNKITITAGNDKGSTTKELVIYRLSASKECEKSENSEMTVCKKKKAEAEAEAEAKAKKEEEEAKEKAEEEARKKRQQENEEKIKNNGSSSCSHYEYNKCWDDIEEQAYDDGYLDAMYNTGHPRYTGCTGVCSDIYDDAYYDGYYYGQHGL